MSRFSTRQITVMVVAGCLAVTLAPATVIAATGSAVNITDPFNAGNKARVATNGTFIGSVTDPSTGSHGRVDAGKVRVGDGSGNLTVDGTVAAVPRAHGSPLDTINDQTVSAADTQQPLFSGVGGKQLAFSSLIASAEGSTAGYVKLLVIAYVKSNSPSGDCNTLAGGFGAAERFSLMVPVGDTVNINWPNPMLWTQYADSNDFYCVNVQSYGGPTGYTAHVSVYGFRN